MNVSSPVENTTFDPAEFAQPPAKFRGAPFWCWNNVLDRDQLLRQIAYFSEMGMGGFHIHSRTGLGTEYLGREFLDITRACVEEAQRRGMRAWLYDEDRWPSGYAGGRATADPQFRARYLLFTPVPYGTGSGLQPAQSVSGVWTNRAENGVLLARYEVTLKSGRLSSYRRLEKADAPAAGARVWHAYLEIQRETAWFNHQAYLDTMNPMAVRKFIETTHEVYAYAVGKHFGETIPAIFTDEPQFMHKMSFQSPADVQDLIVPFTSDLLASYRTAYGQNLEDHLPEIFWELPEGRKSLVRYRYHQHVAERFASAYADQLGDWCQRHHLALTGHMMEERTLQSQTRAVGEAMRSLRSFQLPGIDMLCDRHEYTTAKQAQSVCRQYGRPGVLSELYGVTNWDFDFVGHRGQGDWQAALGVTVRVHHLTWVSMQGEAKRDYPASIGYQSPWYREYPLIEDHFARVNTVLTRGKAVCRIGVIHPIESYWLCFGPLEQTASERAERDQQFEEITQWLLFGLLDFDFISESLFPGLCSDPDITPLPVGAMAYDAIVVPSLQTIRGTTLDRLKKFADAGGAILFTGEVPSMVDAIPSTRPAQLAARCRVAHHSRQAILEELEKVREVGVRLANAMPADTMLAQMREEDSHRYLFLCNTDRKVERAGAEVRLRGEWKITRLDSLTGTTEPLPAHTEEGWTFFRWDFPGCGSLLVMLEPGVPPTNTTTISKPMREISRVADPVPIRLSEPNVLLLDRPEWRLGNSAWNPAEEVLRLDNRVRAALGLPLRSAEGLPQPWTDSRPAPILDYVELRFSVESDVAVEKPMLAVEDSEAVTLFWNGHQVPNRRQGWWVDESIHTLELPSFPAGKHELLVRVVFHRKTELERCYLLGDFGVDVKGSHIKITDAPRELAFGDWTTQGLPFYAGNVTYLCQRPTTPFRLRVARFSSPLLTVDQDGKRIGAIAFPPFELDLPQADSDKPLEITAYGNRRNAFGAIHNCDKLDLWHRPRAFRTTGDAWSDEYQLLPMGILVAPLVQTPA